MAELKTNVALEIGAQSVTMAVFAPAGKGIALSRYARRDIVLDPVEESMRIEYISNAIVEMVAELKVKGSNVANVVSGQQVVMRFIKLPALDMDDMREQVGYEAQQHIPFPLDQITYDYHEVGTTDEGEREVLLVAIKKNVLDELNTQVQASSLHTSSVECSTTSLYNAFRASYPDELESTMIVDIGAKTTEILFAEEGRFFTRSVNAAGGFVTSAIAREHSVSYREAEELKVSKGVIAMGNGHTDSMSPEDAALATTIRTAMGRVSSEIQRTINFYRSQHKGTAPTKVYLCGGGARLPYIVEFIQGALNIPVDYLNPIAPFAIGKNVDEEALAADAVCLGPVLGAAVSSASMGELSIDLVPTSVGLERAEKALIPKVIAAGLIALCGAAGYAWCGMEAQKKAEAQLAKSEVACERIQNIADRVDRAERTYEAQVKAIEKVEELFTMRYAYVDVLLQLMEKSPSVKFWFSEFTPLINYDAHSNDLTGADTVKATKLINMTHSRGAQAASAINPASGNDSKSKDDAPQVTAIYINGYALLDGKVGATNSAERELVRNLINNNFDERNEDSLFSLTSEEIRANENRYIRFITSKESKGKVPGHVERFMLVLPLKKPISIPELGAAD